MARQIEREMKGKKKSKAWALFVRAISAAAQWLEQPRNNSGLVGGANPSGPPTLGAIRLEDDFDALVFFVVEDFVCFGRFIERHGMRDDETFLLLRAANSPRLRKRASNRPPLGTA